MHDLLEIVGAMITIALMLGTVFSFVIVMRLIQRKEKQELEQIKKQLEKRS